MGLKLLDLFRRDLKTFLFRSVYGHQDTQYKYKCLSYSYSYSLYLINVMRNIQTVLYSVYCIKKKRPKCFLCNISYKTRATLTKLDTPFAEQIFRKMIRLNGFHLI